MTLDERVEYNYYFILGFALTFYVCTSLYMMFINKANYLMDNIKHSYTESFDSYDLSELSS